MKKKLKIISWNVNGIRAVIRKDAFLPFVQKSEPDILCVQETKATKGQAEIDLPEYEEIWNSAQKKGYAGTAIFTKIKPLSIIYDIQGTKSERFADTFGNTLTEGRVITAEFEKFYLVTVYTPNSKCDLERLKYRHEVWDPEFLSFIKKLEETKPVIFCGDLNAAHKEIDLARPKDNKKNAGFTAQEREGIDKIVSAGFVDTFRHFFPEKTGVYSWWSNFRQARERNVGWRIDYFFVSEKLKKNLVSAEIHDKIMGSDHCPVEIVIEI
ncbi:exodeoxyribonuclease III [Candidatus Uhrbacteria bacterium CG_4_10_14_0_2_um_filter_41_7]|uniref:Exodeoxyribonuclease III n=1 Tax=Candidatus Uhrbacteria bacterium CG_4_9_14_3_um_filter_41_35 TaxID=1975034 RepID=A0A2M7XFH7_9BACT|nr:MAG: exodeoxyribonuclease III [Candidatus Uhrbacteria bacterium CG11_big_fil_rev_8_21_14_0_20_41_9]PIZ54906.1 MAG: exodeoxyribonuclease III [Candidatus Uhrbacteria bacterium CG_4_10_14_0_2_um_filter_41_7]PJA46486.1 MAG: exodeoxyribonuclease III [Candidatus Uhrbacteria bacterium CG_4_9_14_3_um_filter_41_35]